LKPARSVRGLLISLAGLLLAVGCTPITAPSAALPVPATPAANAGAEPFAILTYIEGDVHVI
jgi:hypothetical protein